MVAAACLLSFWTWLVLAPVSSLEAGAGTGQLLHPAGDPCDAVSGCEPVATAAAISPSLLQRKISKSVLTDVLEEFEEIVEAVITPGSTQAQQASLAAADSSNNRQVSVSAGPQDPRPTPISLAYESSFRTSQDLSHDASTGRTHAAPSQGQAEDALMAASPPKAMEPAVGNEELYFRPVSTTLRCIMWLTVVTLLVHTCLALARNIDELSGRTEASVVTNVLTNAVRGTPFAPVMAMFFLAFRMYILASTHGLGEPSTFVKGCMVVATVGMTLQLIFCIVSGFFVDGSLWHAGDSYNMFPRIEMGGVSKLTLAKGLSMVVQLLCMLFIHGGLACILSAFIQTASFKVSAAVACTISLAGTYFFVELARWAASARIQAVELAGNASKERKEKAEGSVPVMPTRRDPELSAQLSACRAASNTVQRAPMLALLFLAARMRHIQENPPTGEAPAVVVGAFIVAAVSVACEVLVSAYIGYVGKEETGYYRSYVYVGPRLAHCLQHLCSGLSFVAFGVVMTSILHQWGPANQKALSSTMVGVLWLEGVYFTVQFLLWVNAILRDLAGINWRLARDTLLAASVSINFAPLLGTLFLGARMRALQISQHQGDPQWWEQVFVHLSVAAVILQLLCCLCLPIFSGVAASVDPEGNTIYDLRPLVCAYAVTLVKYCALLSLHGGVFGVCVAVFTMDPESTLRGRPDEFAYWHALMGTALWGLCAGLGSAILASCKVLGLAVKFALESVDSMLLGATIKVEHVKFNTCRGYVEVKKLILENMSERGFQTPHLLKVDKVIVQVNLWLLLRSLGKVFEISKLVVIGAEMNFEKARKGPSNVKALLSHLEGSVVPKLPSGVKFLPPKELVLRLGHVHVSSVNVAVTVQRIGGKVGQVSLGEMDMVDFSDRLPTEKGIAELIGFVLKSLLWTAVDNAIIMSTLAKKGAQAMLGSAATTICCPPPASRLQQRVGDGEEDDEDDDEGEGGT